MITTADIWRKLCEKAGYVWHETVDTTADGVFTCSCGRFNRVSAIYIPDSVCRNPSPTDLNAVVELAKKLGYLSILFYQSNTKRGCVIHDEGSSRLGFGDSDTEAAIEALWSAEGEK